MASAKRQVDGWAAEAQTLPGRGANGFQAQQAAEIFG